MAVLLLCVLHLSLCVFYFPVTRVISVKLRESELTMEQLYDIYKTLLRDYSLLEVQKISLENTSLVNISKLNENIQQLREANQTLGEANRRLGEANRKLEEENRRLTGWYQGGTTERWYQWYQGGTTEQRNHGGTTERWYQGGTTETTPTVLGWKTTSTGRYLRRRNSLVTFHNSDPNIRYDFITTY